MRLVKTCLAIHDWQTDVWLLPWGYPFNHDNTRMRLDFLQPLNPIAPVCARVSQWNPNVYLLIAAILPLACAHPCVFLNCLNSTKTQVQLIRYTCVFYVKCIQCRIMSGLLSLGHPKLQMAKWLCRFLFAWPLHATDLAYITGFLMCMYWHALAQKCLMMSHNSWPQHIT